MWQGLLVFKGVNTADSHQLPKVFTDPPPLPVGLEAEIRAHLAVLQLLHGGRGHVTVRIDMAPHAVPRFDFEVGGRGLAVA